MHERRLQSINRMILMHKDRLRYAENLKASLPATHKKAIDRLGIEIGDHRIAIGVLKAHKRELQEEVSQ